MTDICICGPLKVRKEGKRLSDGSEICSACKRPLTLDPPAMTTGATTISKEMVTSLAELPGHRIVRSLGVVTELGATSGFTAASKGNIALDEAMLRLRRSAVIMGANAVVGLRGSPFGAAGGITSAFGGDAVGVLLMGDAVEVVEARTAEIQE